jgi:hypothetical protein
MQVREERDMKYFGRRRKQPGARDTGPRSFNDSDPLSGVANLLDLGLVFIVGLIITLFTAYHLQDLFSEKGSMTIVKQAADGQMEIITKEGRKIKAVKVTRETAKGRGIRLGTAYRLEDGSMVYVPDDGTGK